MLIYLLMVAFATVWCLSAVFATAWVLWPLRLERVFEALHLAELLRRVGFMGPVRRLGGELPPVSVLKPLCGMDDGLEENLRSFFQQDYPTLQLVFGVQGSNDPSVPLVRRLMAEHPDVDARLVVHDGGRGFNPKVANLRASMPSAKHDVVVISDSNVRVRPRYLQSMAHQLMRPGVGLVTSLVCGVGEKNLGALLENAMLNTNMVSGNAVPTAFMDQPVVVGKSMMFRRSVFDLLGGFSSVANVLAEDYIMGRMFHLAGYKVRLSRQPVYNVCVRRGVRCYLGRHTRWGMMRFRMEPAAFVVEPLLWPTTVALAAPLFGMSLWGWVGAWWVLATVVRDGSQWVMLRGWKNLWRALLVAPLRDLLMLTAWLRAPFSRHVNWRGKRLRVDTGTRLFPESHMGLAEDPVLDDPLDEETTLTAV